jgi:hypothetical protein
MLCKPLSRSFYVEAFFAILKRGVMGVVPFDLRAALAAAVWVNSAS